MKIIFAVCWSGISAAAKTALRAILANTTNIHIVGVVVLHRLKAPADRNSPTLSMPIEGKERRK